VIRATFKSDGSILTLNASVNGPAVYLDNWAIIELAKKDSSRRRRFIDLVRSGAEVLFSVTNAAELSGPKGDSADAIRTFLDEIGPHWFPVKLDVTEAVNLETRGKDRGAVCIDEHFFKSYVADRMRSYAPDSGKVISLSDDFFSLAPILDRVGPQWKSIKDGSAGFDKMLKNKMSAVHEKCKLDPLLLDKKFPLVPFDPARPASFVYHNLLRTMAIESNSLTKNDGLDFCHAVMGCAFANFTTLDTGWKRRIANLPKPNWLACIYSYSDLTRMVTDIEQAIARPDRRSFLVLRQSIRKALTGTEGPCRVNELSF
jgi:hypothetical protein